MRRSTERILTSHVGTLPNPPEIESLSGGVENPAFVAALPGAVAAVVEEEIAHGIDIVNDGELSKEGGYGRALGFAQYVRTRLGGYELKPMERLVTREQQRFPELNRAALAQINAPPQPHMVCTGPITYIGSAQIARDIANLRAATADKPVSDVFMASISPDNINYYPPANEYYASEDEYVEANAAAMAEEYRAIAEAGFVLQIDMPVAKYNALSLSVEQFRERFARLIAILNATLAGIPPDQIRVHICYGGGKNPHTGDLELEHFLDLVLDLNANGISYDQNVRHEHEWEIFRDVKLPEGKLLMPGVVAHTTDTVEHPKLIAQRLVRLAELVGRENVIAGTDCGLGGRLPREVAWAKFDAMSEGARLASEQLWP